MLARAIAESLAFAGAAASGSTLRDFPTLACERRLAHRAVCDECGDGCAIAGGERRYSRPDGTGDTYDLCGPHYEALQAAWIP